MGEKGTQKDERKDAGSHNSKEVCSPKHWGIGAWIDVITVSLGISLPRKEEPKE